MVQRIGRRLLIFLVLAVSLLAPGYAGAMEDAFSVRLWGDVAPHLSGAAGTGREAPDYNDAFQTGLGIGGEVSWRMCDRFSWLIGGGYERWRGDAYQGISFDDLDVIPVYTGAKVHAMPGDPHWDPYMRLDLGAAHLSSVDVSVQSLRGRYWNDSWVFCFAVGAGVEYRWGPWGVSLDVKFRYMGEPDAALGQVSEADAAWTVPVALGINYHF